MTQPNIPPNFAKHEAAKRKKLRARLESEGRWETYLTRRKAFRAEHGTSDHINWIAVAFEFPPLDGGPAEFGDADLKFRLAQFQPAEPSASKLIGPDGQEYDASALLEAHLAANRAQMGKKSPAELAKLAREKDWEDLRRKVVAREGRKSYKKPTVAECTLFAWEYSGTPPAEIKPSEVPGRAALPLLMKMSDEGFYTDVSKIVIQKYASKDDDVSEQGIRDDNRKKLLIMSKLENYDTELLDDVELAAAIDEDEKRSAAPAIFDSEDELGADDEPVEVVDPDDDYGAGDVDDHLEIPEEGMNAADQGGDDADPA